MQSARIASLTIIALILLAVCCQVLPTAHAHDTMASVAEPMAHLTLLSISLPTTSFSLLVATLFSIILFAVLQFRQLPLCIAPQRLLTSRPPDHRYSAPLQLAVADGILNPKLY